MPCSACIKTHAHALKSHPDSTGPVPDCSFDDPHEVAEGPKAKIQKLEDKIARLEALLNNTDSKDSEKILRSPSTLAEPSPPSEAEGRPGSAKSTSSPLFSPHPPTISAPTDFTSPSNLGGSHAPSVADLLACLDNTPMPAPVNNILGWQTTTAEAL
ncbi:hypothetical protein FRC02_007534, partial [Tulasnella sp. 418]